MDVGQIRETSVFVVIAGLHYEFLPAMDENLEATHKRVAAKVRAVMTQPPGQRFFEHERPPDPSPPKLGKILPASPIDATPPGPPIVYMIHVPDGAQVQVIPGTTFKLFMREQQAMAMQAQGMPPGLRVPRG